MNIMADLNNQKIKVVFVLPALTAGGAERALITLMNNIDRSRFSSELITINDSGPLGEIIDPDISRYNLDIEKVKSSIPKLFVKLKGLKPDIVVSTMAHMNLCLMVLKPLFPGTRFIIREAITPTFILEEHKSKIRTLRAAYKTLYPLAYAVLSPAQIIFDELHEVLGLRRKNHRLLRNFVDLDRIRAKENQSFEIDKNRKKTIHFVAAGRLHQQKGFDRLIEALKNFESTHDWRLTILGEGEQRKNLEQLIAQNNLSEKVSLPGLSDHPWPEFAKADCFLLPSRSEGMPNVVLESLACGTPVIATSESGGIAEIKSEAAPETVTIANDMKEFVDAMSAIKPKPTAAFRPSLLPDVFQKSAVINEFERILMS